MENKATRPQIKVEFGFSTSPNYDRAVAIAQKLAGYTISGEGRKQRHSLLFNIDQVNDFLFLEDIVREWKSTLYRLDEKDLGRRSPMGLLLCARYHQSSYRSSEYCGKRNYWGCRRVGDYLRTGHFEDDGTFLFDKERFLFEERDDLELLSACPFFRKDFMLRRLDELDDEIDPRTSDNWDYIFSYTGDPEGVHYVPQISREVNFADLEERGEKAWLTRLIPIPDEKWQEYADLGHIPELDIFIEEGWRLVNVVERNDVWYCILERQRGDIRR